MRSYSLLLLVINLSICLLPAPFAGAQQSLETIEDIQKIGLSASHPLNGHYVLARDIDASATASWVGGNGFAPIGDEAAPFTGIFDGQGYEIHGLVINRILIDNVGFFGVVGDDGLIKNLGLTAASVTGKSKVGCLAGVNLGKIVNCYSTGTVISKDLWAGGLIAVNGSIGSVFSCYADVAVTGRYYLGGLIGDNTGTVSTSFALGDITGTGTSGGLIGYHNGTLNDCYALGSVTAEDSVGSLSGECASHAVIQNCYGTGVVQGSTYVGGLTGISSTGSTITASYWDRETTGQETSAGGEGRATEALTYPYAATVYEGWNFYWVWALDTDSRINGGYPYLQDNPPPEPPASGCWGCDCAEGKGAFNRSLGDYLLVGISLTVLLSVKL